MIRPNVRAGSAGASVLALLVLCLILEPALLSPSAWLAPGRQEALVPDQQGSLRPVQIHDDAAKDTLRALFAPVIAQNVAPWTLSWTDVRVTEANGLQPDQTLIRQAMLSALELWSHGSTFRVRYVGGRLQYRQTYDWEMGFMWQRAEWTMTLLQEMADERLFKAPFDALFSVGDGPTVSADWSTHLSGIPIFSRKTTLNHLDMPCPDPATYEDFGLYKPRGKDSLQASYSWPAEDRVPASRWRNKEDAVVFRGSSTCFHFFSNNWLACGRLRAALMKQVSPKDYDLGISQYGYFEGAHWPATKGVGSGGFDDALTQEDMEGLAETAKPMHRNEQAQFRYILDLNGGTGSARMLGILSSGSLLLSPVPTYQTWISQFALPWRHFVPVDPYLSDLSIKLKWLRANPRIAQQIALQGEALARRLGKRRAAKQYMAQILGVYSQILHPDTIENDVLDVDPCAVGSRDFVTKSPTGCGKHFGTFSDTYKFLQDNYKPLQYEP